MEDKTPVIIKTEAEPFSPKKQELNTPITLIPPNLIKKEPTSVRLPSFKPPRDLSLCGSTTSQTIASLKFNINPINKTNKRIYAPNINVIRRKGSSNTPGNETQSQTDSKNKNKDKAKKTPPVKKRNSNVVQTQGVFSEGLAPGKVKSFHSDHAQSAASLAMEKPKLNLNRKIIKKNEDSKLKTLLKDDLIDDPNTIPDITFNPSCLPKVYNVKKKNQFDSPDLDKTFESLQVKIEKIENLKNEEKHSQTEVLSAFEDNEGPRMILFEFPSVIPEKEEPAEKKKLSKSSANELESKNNKVKAGSLNSLGEGLWGYLRVHENGNAYFVVGKNTIPIVLTRHLTRQEVISANIDTAKTKGEVINLGSIDATFTCSTNFF